MSEFTSEEQARSEYFAERAIAEHRLVEAATDPRAAAAHGELAARYEALASNPSLELPDGQKYDQDDEESPVQRNATG